MQCKEMVTGIVDGRTFVSNDGKHLVRLAEVKTPVLGQPGYARTKTELRRLISKKEVTIEPVGEDKRGRTLANVTIGGISVNSAMRNFDWQADLALSP